MSWGIKDWDVIVCSLIVVAEFWELSICIKFGVENLSC